MIKIKKFEFGPSVVTCDFNFSYLSDGDQKDEDSRQSGQKS
jgi:hypothetical protein